MGEPCPAPLRVAMRSPLPFPCVPDRPYKILLVQVGTLSFSHPSFGVPVLFIYLFINISYHGRFAVVARERADLSATLRVDPSRCWTSESLPLVGTALGALGNL